MNSDFTGLGQSRRRISWLTELILIIEDNEKNRKLCRDVLQVKGYRTVESETAEEGLKLVEEKAPALILWTSSCPAWTA